MLSVEGLCAGYHQLQILHDVALHVDEGEIVALVGANGAGKTTMLRAVSGLLIPTSGSITFAGEPVVGVHPHELVRRGLVHVPEGRALFGSLSVLENLQMGGWIHGRKSLEEDLDAVFGLFPVLAERRNQPAETLSGGQQQMLAIGRGLMARPRLLMLDEPSTGLSPKLTWAVLEAVKVIRKHGTAVLLVEQNAAHALALADRAYVLESGTTVLDGPGRELARNDRVREAYLGL
ncbi:ABC transporter ATP-binding protein [Pseudonocardia thermophila]|uniref:ABC transporter ATP-binding protein n=1 Tax=Pseudonocardia thermophila TaxID=1848 RepID=UPI00248DC039|nr:ABC transporter ATP-binding protein [Pseudonocardia thermophila]